MVFIAAVCFPAIAAHQINLSSENSKTEEQMTAEDASISGDNPGRSRKRRDDTQRYRTMRA